MDSFVYKKIEILLPIIIELLESNDKLSVENELLNVYKEIEIYLSRMLKKSVAIIKRESLELKEESNSFTKKKDIELNILTILPPIITTIPIPPQIKIVLTTIIGVVSALFREDNEVDLENERRRTKALQISQATREIKSKILNSILKQTKEIIEQSFQDSLDRMKKNIQKEKGNIDREKNIKTLLNEARIRIDNINF